jgi:hypothetical protein
LGDFFFGDFFFFFFEDEGSVEGAVACEGIRFCFCFFFDGDGAGEDVGEDVGEDFRFVFEGGESEGKEVGFCFEGETPRKSSRSLFADQRQLRFSNLVMVMVARANLTTIRCPRPSCPGMATTEAAYSFDILLE